MPKFTFQEVGREGIAFLQAMGARRPGRYYGAVERIVNYPGTSVGEVLQDLDANGLDVDGKHFTLYTYDPDSFPKDAMLRAALEQYGDEREAAAKARAEARKRRT